MEDELRIKCGNKWAILAICCIAIAVFMAVNEKNLPMDRDIAAVISGILMGIGWFVLLLFPGRVYKVDRKGITVYVRNAGIFTPWSDCVFMGVDREIILFIVCIRRQGDRFLRKWDNMRLRIS